MDWVEKEDDVGGVFELKENEGGKNLKEEEDEANRERRRKDGIGGEASFLSFP